MRFTGRFTGPFFTGTTTSPLVPHVFDVAIGGRGYMLDRAYMASQYGATPIVSSIRATRAQSDSSSEPGEQSLNPDDLWRRSQQSWHFGAGQDYLDRDDSDRRRFRTSKGVNPWTQGQVSLLNATAQSLSASGSNLALMPAGSRLYAVDGTALKYTTDLTSWTTVTGTSGASITGIASDGYYVWVTDGANIYRTNTGTGAAASWSTEDADLIGYVKGRLMIAKGPTLKYCSDMSGPTFSSALFTHANANFAYVGFAEGPAHIYTAGYVGDKSLVYRIPIAKEGASLDPPIVAGELPDGEIVYSIGSYLGFIFLGTSKGARFCNVDAQGNLTIGSIIATSNPVRCFEGQDEFVWFGWTNYDGTSTGLGRMSLRTFTDIGSLKPAYATDLMVTSTANVLSVCTFNNLRVFAVSAAGIYKEDTTNLVSSGTLETGRFNYGITEKKIPLYLDVTFKGTFAGTYAGYYATDGATSFALAGSHTSAASTADTFQITEAPADQIEVRHSFTRDAGTTTTGPVLIRSTIRAQPIPSLRNKIVLPLVLHDEVDTAQRSGKHRYDVAAEFEILTGYRTSKQVVSVQIGDKAYACSLDDFDMLAKQRTADGSFWQGTYLAQFKTV